MTEGNPYSLFGFDLSHIALRVKLGLRQLLLGEESGFRRWLTPDPMPKTLLQDGGGYRIAENEALAGASSESFVQAAFLVPDEEVLFTRALIPAKAEIYLERVLESEVQSRTPFEQDNTCWGYSIAERSEEMLRVDLAISSTAVANSVREDVVAQAGLSSEEVELWADFDGRAILFNGFEGHRIERFKEELKALASKLALSLLALVCVTALPPLALNIYAAQLQDMLRETEDRAAAVLATRSDLVAAQQKFAEAEAYFDRFVDYGPWLHRIAQLSPDSVYLTRLSLKEKRLTISGLAENAANYQNALAEAAVFSELEAPSAFTRDARIGAERFTLTMQLSDGADQ